MVTPSISAIIPEWDEVAKLVAFNCHGHTPS
jgi:hypothetical protein